MNKKFSTVLFGLITAFLLMGGFMSCTDSGSDQIIPDVSAISLTDIEFVRYDREVAALKTDNMKDSYEELLLRYPIFTDLYFKRILEIPFENDDSFYNTISEFVQADEIRLLQDTIEVAYPDTKEIEEDLKEAFKLLLYYFPEFQIPNIYFFQSEFGYQTIIFSDTDRDAIAIGLDMFLGEDFDYKALDPRNPAFSDYLTRSYNKDHIVRKAMILLLEDVVGQVNGKRFLDKIIHDGKKLYILDRLLPLEEDTIVYEYTAEHWEWLKNNELEMWGFFLENELIYETSHLKIDKYVNVSPNAPGMPPEAPGRTGTYIGYRIVEAYMDRNPALGLKDLIDETDSQKLMELSKYKPKRR